MEFWSDVDVDVDVDEVMVVWNNNAPNTDKNSNGEG